MTIRRKKPLMKRDDRSTISTFARKYRLRAIFEVEGDTTPVIPGTAGTIYEFEPGVVAVTCEPAGLKSLERAGFSVGTGYACFSRLNDTHCNIAIKTAGCEQRPKRVMSPAQLEALRTGAFRSEVSCKDAEAVV
jgi:hypothetical protein